MKKMIFFVSVFMIVFVTAFTVKSNAEEIVYINTSINKTIVHPGDTITLTIGFDKPLGAYTLDILYDDNLLIYENFTEGNLYDLANGIRIEYYNDTTASNGLIITFRAKPGITTSNKTNFAVTGTGLASITDEKYENVDIPVNKNFTVEPEYTDYTISLTYDGIILPSEEKELKIGITSPIGRYHDKVRLIAELIKPVGSLVTIIGLDNTNTEHDLIKEGWGDISGYSIGGKDFSQEFKFIGMFDTPGNYRLSLRLVDLDGNITIVEKSFDIRVGEELPKELPKTGYDSVVAIALFSIFSLLGFAYYIEWKNR